MEEGKEDEVNPAVLINWREKQDQIKEQIVMEDSENIDWDFNENYHLETGDDERRKIRFIGGLDISFEKGTDQACASLVILSYPSLEVMEEIHRHPITMIEPYKAGFLAFREASFLISLLEEVNKENPSFYPDVLMFDGNGVLHHRGCGIASHVGVLVDIPSIGVAKNLLMIDGLERSEVRRLLDEEGEEDFIELVGESGRCWGAALCPTPSVNNPIFVSIGHKISLSSALSLVRNCSLHRVPEPIRQADLRSREIIRNHQQEISSSSSGKIESKMNNEDDTN